jgi:hypothetical protein
MLGWLIGKRVDSKLSEFHSSIKGSFLNIREDMSHISKWVTHFKDKHETHEKKFDEQSQHMSMLNLRVQQLEDLLAVKLAVREVDETNAKVIYEGGESSEKFIEPIKSKVFTKIETLTYSQKIMLWMIVRLCKGSKSGFISFKDIACEMYSQKKYNQVRSMISETVTLFAADNLVKRKKIGRNMFLSLTEDSGQVLMALEKDEEMAEKMRNFNI